MDDEVKNPLSICTELVDGITETLLECMGKSIDPNPDECFTEKNVPKYWKDIMATIIEKQSAKFIQAYSAMICYEEMHPEHIPASMLMRDIDDSNKIIGIMSLYHDKKVAVIVAAIPLFGGEMGVLQLLWNPKTPNNLKFASCDMINRAYKKIYESGKKQYKESKKNARKLHFGNCN